jgi:hypothetical protein
MLLSSLNTILHALRCVTARACGSPAHRSSADPCTPSLTQGLSKPIHDITEPVVGLTKGLTTPLLDVTKGITAPLLDVTKDITAPLLDVTKGVTAPVLDALKDVSAPLLGAVHDITEPLLEPVKQIAHPLLGVVDGVTSSLGLPSLENLPLLNLLQTSSGDSTGEHTAGVQSLAVNDTASDDAPSLMMLAKAKPAQVHVEDADPTSCQVTAYDVPVEDIIFAPFDYAQANIYRYRQQQSVNLGSWYVGHYMFEFNYTDLPLRFVHENWMTPSVFTCAAGSRASELDIATGWGSPSNARAVLEHHWDTWITQDDFAYLAGIGINTVRLPLGYWSLGPDFTYGTDFAAVAEVYSGSWWRVKRAISWAASHGIGVLVDFHGAPGSQNGQSHSGISTGKTGLFNSEDNMSKAINALTYLTQQLGGVTNVVGIQILNEPDNVPSLPAFCTSPRMCDAVLSLTVLCCPDDRAISTMRSSSPHGQTLPLYVHDGFDLDRFSAYVTNRTDFVVEDHHSYFVFTPHDAAEPVRQHTVDIATGTDRALALASGRQRRNLVIGEWSCALTAQSLQNDVDPVEARTSFCSGQEEVYRNETAGWYFWCTYPSFSLPSQTNIC